METGSNWLTTGARNDPIDGFNVNYLIEDVNKSFILVDRIAI